MPRRPYNRQRARPAGRAPEGTRPDQRLQLRRVGSARGAVTRIELERARVDAVAEAARVTRAVLEHVPEVAAAVAAGDLGAAHEQRVVRARLDRGGDGWLGEARPAGAGVELRRGREQLGAAARAAVHAVLLDVPVLAGERALGAALAQHLVLLGRELLAPLLVGLVDLLGSHALKGMTLAHRISR